MISPEAVRRSFPKAGIYKSSSLKNGVVEESGDGDTSWECLFGRLGHYKLQ